jgi:hypothetical protein
MVELCIFKGHSNFFPALMLDIYLHFSELKIPKVFIYSTYEKVVILSDSSTNSNDEILTFNNLYLKIGHISSSQERFKQMTYNYFKKKMLGNLLYAMATELYRDIPKELFLFQEIQIPGELVGSILKHYIEHFYSTESVLGDIYIKFTRIYEEIFKLNNIW